MKGLIEYKRFISRNLVLILFTASVAVVFIVSVYANVLISFYMKTMEYNIKQRLIAVGKQAAVLVSAEELDRYRKPEDMELASYKALRERLRDFAAEMDVVYVYFTRQEGNRMQYIVDNDFNEETRVGLDTPTFDPNKEFWLLSALQGEITYSGLGNYTPGWEGLLTTYVPVFDKDRNVAALVGVDFLDKPIVRAKWLLKILTAVQIISVFTVFASGFISQIRFRREADNAVRASEAKSNFLSRMSHEIRTPMNAIIGMGELALRSESLPRILEYVGGIKQAGHNLLSLINDVLDFSKIEEGSLRVKKAPYVLVSLLNDVINLIRVRMIEKPILFMVNVDAGLPSNLLGDETRIRQILVNLLSNAAKYTSRGFVHLRVSAGTEISASDSFRLNLEISDTGTGIKKKDMEHLFNEFVRLDLDRNNNVEGTGLGLAISRGLCQSMGGEITAASEFGKGSVFTVSLPQTVLKKDALALVEDPESKAVLFYDHRPGYAESLLETLSNLKVPAKTVSTSVAFLKELSTGTTPFAFVSGRLLEEARETIREKALKTRLVLLADMGEMPSIESALVIPMPAYAVTVANVLNGKGNIQYREDSDAHFTAPKARLLVVDDITTNLKVTEGLLTPYKAQVDTCLSGAEALELFKKQPYDLIFMDHMMPDMDGIETTQAIRAIEAERQDGGETPIVALTANAIRGMREMFLGKGFNDYLPKPMEIAKLNEVLKKWIPSEKQEQQGAVEEEREPGPGILDGLQVEGVNLDMGKKRYQGNAYLEVLRSYLTYTPPLMEKMLTLSSPISEDTLKDYTITIHGLKGSSSGICAEEIAKKAEALENAARAGSLDFIRDHNPAFIEDLKILLENIKKLLEKIQDEKTKPLAPKPDPRLLAQLFEACKHYRTNIMEETLKALEKYDYESGGDLVVWLQEQADNLEYDAMRDKLEEFT